MLHQRAFAASLLMTLAACSSSSTPGNGSNTGDASTGGGADTGTGSTGPTRKTVTCSDIAKDEALSGTYTAGSWGDVPSSLQALPSGAALCGSTSIAGNLYTHIVSTAWDQDIFTFYNPIVTKLGCTLKPMDTNNGENTTYSRTSFSCTDGSSGTISASDETQYVMTYSAAKK